MKRNTLTIVPFFLFASFLINQVMNQPQKSETGALQFDGPHVLYKNDSIFVKYVFNNGGSKSIHIDSFLLKQRPALSLKVATDIPGETFTVTLKKQLQVEKSVFPKADKQLVISDIEANFKAFRKLLLVNKVIDENFNWIFGKGYLILTGDFVDRGDQQTEVLWLIYALEEKAKAAGGYVHYVLGNHEVMNMDNDLRYVHPKYFETAALIGENYLNLYSENSELGRWLRTKNVAQSIGGILYVHGGISQAVNRINLPVQDINKLTRPYFGDTNYIYSDPIVDTLYSDLGPFWYRGYYAGTNRASKEQVDSSLSLFGVKKIITGHTIIADTISVLFSGKVLNVDVKHAMGHSEALLIENKKFYRVTDQGERFQINN